MHQLYSVPKHKYFEDTSLQDKESGSFRLQRLAADLYRCDTESVASSSATSKHRIDMLFSDNRSTASEYHIRPPHRQNRKVKSLVENTYDELDQHYYTGVKNDVQANIEKMFSEVSSSDQETDSSITGNKFDVLHLGSVPVPSKITSLEGLQEPVKELYFKYRAKSRKTSGSIRIAENGLYVEYNGNYDSKIEKLIPFTSIAIWSSLKFSQRRRNSVHEFAFLPLVANSSTDKESLFQAADDIELEDDNSPIFVIVMKDPDTKQMVCHGFVCESHNDAVVLAATLYKVLIRKLGRNRNKILRNKHHRRSQKLSSIGEMTNEKAAESPPPKRPPRKLKDRVSGDEAGERRKELNSETGDVLTKVAIPGSSGFLVTNRLSSRYKNIRGTEDEVQVSTNSPLGFNEMFDELRSQEGLKTVDEILNAIIKADGMSYNDLKPIYKEFLLKLALVLSKDELFHRSENIIKSQKKKTARGGRLKKIVTTKKGLKNMLRKPIVRLRKTKTECRCAADCTSTDSFVVDSHPKSRPKPFQEDPKDTEARPSSSGYFSFSECSYDTESCTCTSADKCYCSISKSKCHYSTAQCNKKGKCYCSPRLSLVEQLKRNGFAASDSSQSPSERNVRDRGKLSKSLEYLERDRNRYRSRMELYDKSQLATPCKHTYDYSNTDSSRTGKSVSSDNLAVDYSMFARSDMTRKQREEFARHNVIYAELVEPRMECGPVFNRCYRCHMNPVISRFNEESPMYYPQLNSPCSCNCSCSVMHPMHRNHHRLANSMQYRRMNIESTLGYFP